MLADYLETRQGCGVWFQRWLTLCTLLNTLLVANKCMLELVKDWGLQWPARLGYHWLLWALFCR
jgi:hypothetical protein